MPLYAYEYAWIHESWAWNEDIRSQYKLKLDSGDFNATDVFKMCICFVYATI